MSKSFEQLGCSKINIGLAITGKRDDGYHNIDSIFQSIRLSDSIYFAKHHSVVFSGGAPELPDYMQKLVSYGEDNLALKAMLLGLNRFWDLRLTQEELLNIGASLGSDVPFLLQGGTARGTGRGEVLTYSQSPEAHWLLLVKPKVSISTAVAYGRFNGKSKATAKTIDTVLNHLQNNDLQSAFTSSANTFEELLFPDHEELGICKEFFTSRGYPTIMTGSGPTMVVLLNKPMEALQLQEEIKAAGHDWLSLITKTCTQEDLV